MPPERRRLLIKVGIRRIFQGASQASPEHSTLQRTRGGSNLGAAKAKQAGAQSRDHLLRLR
jgi:hypothetical protein